LRFRTNLSSPEKTDKLLSFNEEEKLDGDGAFEKSKRINLGGPGYYKRKKHMVSVNRNT
jgi:hypothetical protein